MRAASQKTIDRVIAAAARRADLVKHWGDLSPGDAEILDAVTAFRAETAPLRTREQVEADIVKVIREAAKTHTLQNSSTALMLYTLIDENTEETKDLQCSRCMLLKSEEPSVSVRQDAGDGKTAYCNDCFRNYWT